MYKILHALVANQRLIQVGLVVNDIDEVVHDPALAAHDQIQVAQADIKIDHHGSIAALGQAGGETGAGRGFAHASLAGGHDDNGCQAATSHRLS
jgi:hypothetical protein